MPVKQGDIIRFAWNPFFNEPSSLIDFTIERIVKRDHDGLYVDMRDRKIGAYKLRLNDLQEMFDFYEGEVEPISRVEEDVQISLSM